MKYFKCRNTNRLDKTVFNEQIKSLNKKKRKKYKRQKLFKILLFFLWLIVVLTGIFCFISLSNLITVSGEKSLVNILLKILRLLIIPIGIFITLIFSVFIIGKISDKIDWLKIPEKTKEIIKNACEQLRKFYGFNSPFIVTKCYSSSNERFIRQDVCLFFKDNKIRITKDIYNGFTKGINDLGCYEFELREIEINYIIFNNKTATEIISENMNFILGKRAKFFIEKSITFDLSI